MSDLIFTWLNDEVQLTKKIASFEYDFANGYYFGELLSKYNQQLNFKEFKNADTREAKMTNFNLLQPTFRTLKVEFNSQTVDDIINCRKDVASQILYQLKMALEKVNNPADVIINSKAGRYNTVTPLMRINPPIPQFANMESKFFNSRLNSLNRSQKAVNQDNHLKKFDEFKIQQDIIIKKLKESEEEKEKQLKEQMRKIELNKLQRNMAFQEDWNEKGLEQWKKNQEVTKQRVEADRQFEYKQKHKEETKRLQIKELTKNETNRDIDMFEETLKKKGLLLEEDEDGNIIKKEHKNTISATATMKRIKEKSQVNEFLRKERDKRRRKMIVDQAKFQRDIEVRKREELVLKKLEQQSRQEKEIEYEVWRAYQCKQIIIQDRFLRDEKYKQKNEVNVVNAKYKEEELLKILRQENENDILSKLSRQREIEISEKQQNRKGVYSKCKNLIEQLVDLANICYEQQQQQDSEDIDTHFLNDQIKLFIDNKPLLKEKQFRNYETIPNLRNQEQSQPESKDFLADQDLQDYLEGRGEWIPQHRFDNQGEDPLNNDEKYIPNQSLNNYHLGNLVVGIIKDFYSSEIEQSQREVINHFDWLPLKLAILGYQFSGKKTIANIISKKYGVKLLSIDILMNELIEKYHDYQRQVQMQLREEKIRSSKSSSRPNNNSAGQIERNDVNSGSNRNNKSQANIAGSRISQQQIEEDNQSVELDEESIQLAQKIEQCLYSGQDIPDEYYIKLIQKVLNQIHPEVTQQQFLEQLAQKNIPSENEQLLRLPNLGQDLQMPPTKEDTFRNALVNRTHKYTSGIILLDFPHTYEQAKLLEKEISGFLPKDEIIQSEFEKSIENAQKIVKPTKVETKPRQLIKPGLDLVIYIDIDKKESLRRALGRRYDPLTKQNFHLDDNPPPVDNAPLIERLEQIREYGTSELAIVDKNCELDNNFKQLKEWYTLFGNKFEIRTLIEQEQLSQDEQQPGSRQGTLENNEQVNYQQQAGSMNQNLEENAQNAQNSHPEEQLENGEEQNQLVPQQPKYNLAQEYQIAWQEVNGKDKIDEVFYQVDKIIDRVLIAKEQKYEAIQNKLDSIEERKKQDEEIARIKKENEAKWLFTTREEILQDLQNFSASIKINPIALKNLVTLWKNTQDIYVNSSKFVFYNLREQKQSILLRFHDIQKRFLELIQRPDQKFMLMRQFQQEYNKFVELNPDMCEEDQTKEELHQRVEDLHDQLYDIIEAKRDEASEERNQIIKSGWIEKEIEKFMFLIQQLLQAELSRSFSCQQIINDYYVLIQGGELQEIPEYFKNDIVQNQESLPSIEENNNFPRLEKLVDLTLKLHQGEEEVEEKPGAKKGATKAPPKKDDKKPPAKKGGKNVVEEVEEKKELTPIEKEQKEAINMEKAIFRYRVQVIKDFALSKLKLMKAQSQLLYGKLQDWIDYTFKAENDAVNEMDAILRQYIEEEKKIQKEIQLNYVDIVISHEILNFLTPPPIILPAKEPVYENKFSISQLYIIIEELKSITNENNQIESRTLLQLFTRKTLNQISKWDLPEFWRNNTIKTYQKLIQNLDPNITGYINSKDICTYICLSGSHIPTQAEEESYFEKLKPNSSGDDMIEKAQFINTQSWFDEIESCKLEIDTYLFDRPRYIKELLFYIHKDLETEFIDLDNFIQSISASHYIQLRENEQITTYTDLLLS
ncbi:hypothetical protein ABPG72_012429 [Tetrahymena utriculariae]